jgi:DNA adenine methylase
LLAADVEIECCDFQAVLDKAQAGDFMYFDPHYVPISKTAHFANYVKSGFHRHHQEKLAEVFIELTKKGALAMLSNSNTPLVTPSIVNLLSKRSMPPAPLIAAAISAEKKPTKS